MIPQGNPRIAKLYRLISKKKTKQTNKTQKTKVHRAINQKSIFVK